jgi:hypothetical protein
MVNEDVRGEVGEGSAACGAGASTDTLLSREPERPIAPDEDLG